MPPDAFLRKVIAQRELEQERQILDMAPDELAAPPCRVCGGAVKVTAHPQLTVCSKCGGRKRERLLKKLDAARAKEGLGPAPIDLTPRYCKLGCGRRVRPGNMRGVCKTCR